MRGTEEVAGSIPAPPTALFGNKRREEDLVKRIFIICPVRNVDPVTKRKLERHVARMEKKGYRVHYPSRDTDQSDPIGNRICATNQGAIFEADEIHVWYSEQSTGSYFDLGGVFMLIEVLGYKKRVVIINNRQVLAAPGKSFLKVLRYLASKKQQ